MNAIDKEKLDRHLFLKKVFNKNLSDFSNHFMVEYRHIDNTHRYFLKKIAELEVEIHLLKMKIGE